MEQSASVKSLADALSKAQAAIEGAVKGKVNPAFKSKYADLASVWEACREALTANGLSVIQSPGEIADGRMAMTTQLMHASGEWVRGSLTIPLGKVDAHGYGSATTYARRFALAAFVGVAPEDDDGMAAAKAKPTAANGPRDAAPPEDEGRDDSSGRKRAAQAKRDGDDETIKAEIAALDMKGLADFNADFDRLTAHLPMSWLDPVRDMLEARFIEIGGTARVADGEAELDEGFRQAVGPSGGRSAPLARDGRPVEQAA